MKYLRLIVFMFFLFSVAASRLNAQSTLYVKQIDETQTPFAISEIQKISFQFGNIKITKTNEETQDYLLNDIQFLSFIDYSIVLPTVTISSLPSSIPENSGVSELIATLSNTATEDVTVNLNYTGTASNGTDYNAAASIIILAGNLTGSTNITSMNDFIIEGDESVIIDISNVLGGGATEDEDQQTTVVIADDDFELDLVVTKTINDNTPNVGDYVTYTITAANNGPVMATNLVITDALPVGLSFVSATPSIGTWLSPNWIIGDLNIDESETILIVATINSGTLGLEIVNTVSNSQDQIDNNYTVDDNSEAITVTNSVGIINTAENSVKKLRLYPNPVSNMLHIEFCGDETEMRLIEILDEQGKVLQIVHLQRGKTSIDVSEFKPGIYFCKEQNNENGEKMKFIKY